MEVTDAVVDSDYIHDFEPLDTDHNTHVVIDRGHNTIYAQGESSGAGTMLDIMERDGFAISYAEGPLDQSLDSADVLIIHGLPNDEIELPSGESLWRSPLSPEEVEAVVRWVDDGGSLFLTLSHFPNGSGARPLLDAMAVQFIDGYIWHEDTPSFDDPKNGRCSHFFGMSPEQGMVNSEHPLFANGLPINRVDYLCGAAVWRTPEDAILPFPPGTQSHLNGRIRSDEPSFIKTSDQYAGMIGFQFGGGRVVISADQGMFRDFIFTFNETERVHVTITSPDNDNADLFINLMRWLAVEPES